MFRLSLLTFFSIIFYIQADPYICTGENIIDPPTDINNAWYYPNGWKDSDNPPTYAANQTCQWKINVPKGMFALLTITGIMNSTILQVTDPAGNKDLVPYAVDQDPYFLLDPQFFVDFESYREGTLGMKVTWNTVGSFNPSSEQVLPNTLPIVKSSEDCDNGLLIYSKTHVSLVSIRPPSTNKEMILNMRNTVVFDGRTMNDKLIGNLFQIYEKGNHVVSSGQYLTLYSFMPSVESENYALIQDYENVKQFSVYQGISCFSNVFCAVIMDARNGPGAAIRMYDSSQYLEEIQITDDSKISVYTGTVEPSHQLAQYSEEQKLTAIQKFNGLFTTFTLDQGITIAHLTNDPANWTNIFDGRNGVIASKNYGISSTDQNVQETFSGPPADVYKMTLNIKNAGLTDDATLTITSSSRGNIDFDAKYTSKQQPPATIYVHGNNLVVKYDTNGSKTNGIFMEFDCEKIIDPTISSSVGTTNTVQSTRFTGSPTMETTTKSSSSNFSIHIFIVSFIYFIMY